MNQDRNGSDIPTANPVTGTTLSEDGYVRLIFDALVSVPLVHLISGVDEEAMCGSGRDVSPTEIRGYTEWISTTSPVLTLGWDWQLGIVCGEIRCSRLCAPRSNVMLIDESGRDLGAQTNERLISFAVDACDWHSRVMAFITARYS